MNKLAYLFLRVILVGSAVIADGNPMVGGAPMLRTKNIVSNAVNSADHTTLVAAVKAAGLVETLESPGPFTVFASTNEAFAKLPAGTLDTLTKVLTHHVVAGKMSSKDLWKAQSRERLGHSEDGERRDAQGQHHGQGHRAP
jgi:uncharacterized surface protein with fasciclin (FAS1) repeats